MWDAVMNYQFTRACLSFFVGDAVDLENLRKTSLFPLPPAGAESFRKSLERLQGLYPPAISAVMLNLLDSHDMARFLTMARNDLSALRLATAFQMTYPGAPSIYYGDEVGMQGGHDPANRGAFPWHRPETWNKDLLHEFQRLIALRRNRPALRRGSFRILHAAGEVFAHARQLGSETVVAVFNAGRHAHRIDLPLHGIIPAETILENVWSHEPHRVEQGLLHRLELAPRSSLILATTARGHSRTDSSGSLT
jgi:neopullulanase